MPIPLTDQLPRNLLQLPLLASLQRPPGYNLRFLFGRLQPRGQPLLCMLRTGLLRPMRMGSFLLQLILLFSLSLLSLSRS